MLDNWLETLHFGLQKSMPFFVTFVLVARQGRIGSYLLAFLVGLVMDVYSSSPMGINIFALLLFTLLIRHLRRYLLSISFQSNWLLFAFLGLIFMLLKWSLLMLYYGRFLSLSEALLSFLATVMFYPLIVYVNVWIQNKFIITGDLDE